MTDDYKLIAKEKRRPLLYSRALIWQIMLIVLLSVVVYANTLSNEFVWDDHTQIIDSITIRDLSNIPSFLMKSVTMKEEEVGVYYRPVFTASLALDYAVWKLDPMGYHLTNMLLHALAASLVFITAKKLLRSDAVSLIAAAIFAVHPAHAETVAWVSARGHLLAAVFMLASFIFYITYREGAQKKYLVLSLICSLSSFLSIEMAVTLPGIVLLYELLKNKKTARLGPVAFFAASLCLYLVLRNNMLSDFGTDVNTLPLLSRVLTAPVVISKYIIAFLFPFTLKVGYDIKPLESVLNPAFFATVIMLAGVTWLASRSIMKKFIIFFGILWFFVTLIPVLSIIKQVHPMLMSLRYLYIPSVGLSLSVAAILNQILQKLPVKYEIIVLAVVVILLSLVTFHENRKWSSEFILFKHMTADNPGSALAHDNLGHSYHNSHRYKEAEVEYQKSLKLKTDWQILPNVWDIYRNLAILYDKQNQPEKAILMSKMALKYNSDLPDLHYNLAVIYDDQGRFEEAVNEYLEAIRIRPSYPEAHYNLGLIYEKRGTIDEAINEYLEAIRIRPSYPEAHYNLGNLYVKKSNLSEAIREYSITVSLKSEHDKARNNLALAYFINGDREAAMKEYGMLKTLNPELANKLQAVLFK